MKPGANISSLLHTATSPELGPGPRPGVRGLADLNAALDSALAGTRLSASRPDLVRATVLLWHDHHDPAHTLCQSVENADGSYVHGILHRREPDFGNAAYWFRRVGTHPCFAGLAERAAALLLAAGDAGLASRLLPGGRWDPFAFVDACESAWRRPGGATAGLLQRMQAEEFALLLDYLLSGVDG
jgi:hypothetical protein